MTATCEWPVGRSQRICGKLASTGPDWDDVLLDRFDLKPVCPKHQLAWTREAAADPDNKAIKVKNTHGMTPDEMRRATDAEYQRMVHVAEQVKKTRYMAILRIEDPDEFAVKWNRTLQVDPLGYIPDHNAEAAEAEYKRQLEEFLATHDGIEEFVPDLGVVIPKWEDIKP